MAEAPRADGESTCACRAAVQGMRAEGQRVQIASSFSVCLPFTSRPKNRCDGRGLECKTVEGSYHALHFTPRLGNAPTATYSAIEQSTIISEEQLKTASDAMLNAQVALLARAKNRAILHEERVRVGVYYGRRVTYRTRADYGEGTVSAQTIIVALAPQGKICQFTFVPSADFADHAAAFADAFFSTIRPAVRPCSDSE